MTKGDSSTKTFVAPNDKWGRFKTLCPLKLGKSASEVMRDMMLSKLAELEGMTTPEQKQETQLTIIDLQAKNKGLSKELDNLKKTLLDHKVWNELVDVIKHSARTKVAGA